MDYATFKNLPGCLKQDKPRGLHVNDGNGWRAAHGWEMAALQNGRTAWMAGLLEPMPGAYLRQTLQLLYEGGYYGEISDAVTACSAYRQQDYRCRQRGRP